MSDTFVITEEKIKAIRGFLGEIGNSFIREEAEKAFRREAAKAIQQEQDLTAKQVKYLIDLHVKRERTEQALTEMTDAVDIYNVVFENKFDN